MKKYLFLFALLTAALSVGLIVGCQDKNPSSIPPNTGGGIASIEIRLTHEIVRGFINEQRTETVTAIARDATGGAVPGKEIQFSISPPAGQSLQVWMGTIAPAGTDTATNIDGQFFGTYSVQLQRSTKINIVASSGNVVSSRPITLTVVDNELGGVSILIFSRCPHINLIFSRLCHEHVLQAKSPCKRRGVPCQSQILDEVFDIYRASLCCFLLAQDN